MRAKLFQLGVGHAVVAILKRPVARGDESRRSLSAAGSQAANARQPAGHITSCDSGGMAVVSGAAGPASSKVHPRRLDAA